MNNKLFFSSARTGNSKQDKWQTPPAVFEKLNEEFNFTLDATAEPQTALCDHYFTIDDDALTQDWGNQTVYCNPPYSQLKDFAKKAQEEAQKGATVVMLVPARTDTKAFHDYLSHGEVRLIKGRIKFLMEGKEQDAAPFPSMVCVMGKDREQKIGTTTQDSLTLESK